MLTNEQKNIPIRLHDGLTIEFFRDDNTHDGLTIEFFRDDNTHRGTMMQTGMDSWLLMCDPSHKDHSWNLYAYNRWGDNELKTTYPNTVTIAKLEKFYRIAINFYWLAKPIGVEGK